eukprot:gb/GECH01010402.1/.p1 GENE.gb/GECH01010402.1/~~gb/GECH01010402.1/.p1  ORF type:complete len:209 (+),score=-1.75 gb/GECH01010402.1/:1-627(+)
MRLYNSHLRSLLQHVWHRNRHEIREYFQSHKSIKNIDIDQGFELQNHIKKGLNVLSCGPLGKTHHLKKYARKFNATYIDFSNIRGVSNSFLPPQQLFINNFPKYSDPFGFIERFLFSNEALYHIFESHSKSTKDNNKTDFLDFQLSFIGLEVKENLFSELENRDMLIEELRPRTILFDHAERLIEEEKEYILKDICTHMQRKSCSSKA